MAVWSQTAAEIRSAIITLFKNMTQRTNPTYTERQLIDGAINEALQKICLARGVDRWRFLQSDKTYTLTSGTGYVDLDSTVFNVLNSTVRIPSEDIWLAATSLEAIYTADPDRDDTGTPCAYALDSSGSTDAIRLQLYPIPDQGFTLYMTVEEMVDQDTTSDVPSWMGGMLTDLATAIAMRRIGFGNPIPYELAYNDSLMDMVNKQGYDGPMHVQRGVSMMYRGLQSRAN